MDYWATPEATRKLMDYLGCKDEESLYEILHIDRVITVHPKYVGPPLADGSDGSTIDLVTGTTWTPGAGADIYGNRFRDVEYDGGVYLECIYHALAQYNSVDEIEDKYTWPSLDDWDYSVIPEQIKGHEDLPIKGGGSEPFLVYKYLRGDEQAFIDLIENPEMVHYCLDKLYGLCYENTRRIYEQIPGKVMITYVAEDLGSQDGLLYSPDQIREFFIPRMKRMIDLAHQAGAFVFHHSDGAIREILPDMIEAGIDVLNPIQWRCAGMDREGLKRDFGDKIIFHGGVDNQKTLPFGTVEDVRKEVIDNINILGKEGYILAPCHNIQVNTPPENVVAMYQTGYQEGWFE
ncbi:MAG: uroporphyrinogen-III decarboxylase-like protein [Planctomycetes bacterium]|nr:uroporphyrinogen-III decarboxylase-like protein [Planctomycetota bacterium]